MKILVPLAAITLGLAACNSPETAASPDPVASAGESGASSSPVGAPADSAPEQVLRLEGLGDLAIGAPVPDGSSFAERGAQVPGSDCHTISSPDYPGVYAIASGGEVRRITVGDSPVRLVEGIGPGSTIDEVLAAFPGFVESPHKYVEAPASYLTQPGREPRLRFEIGSDGKVQLVHVGLMPELGYVEGCA